MARLKIMAALALISLSCAFADTVTITLVQNEKAPAIALDMSNTIEDEIFGRFYEAGHIASNTDLRFDGSKYHDQNYGVKEAAFGLSDFLVAVSVQYGPAEITDTEKKITYAELDSLTWRVVDVKTAKTVVEKKIDIKKIKVTQSDPYQQARIYAGMATDEALAAIAKFNEGRNDR